MATSWCRIALCFFACIVAASASLGDPNADPTLVLYLQRLFDSVKGRQPRGGELNLLPDESCGFANTVHCFSARREIRRNSSECKPPVSKRALKLNRRSSVETQRTNRGGCELPANKRELKFNLSSLMPSEKVVALELLIEVPEANSTPLQGYNITFYEFQYESGGWGFLATHPIIYNTSAESAHDRWLTFNIINVNHSDTPVRENYRLQIELTGKNLPPDAELISLLDNLAFKLITFTHDNQSLEHLAVPSGMGEEAGKKKRAAPTRLQTLAMEECSVQFHFSSYRELGWPGSDVHVITPTNANFSFCHGHCNSPYGNNHQIYTRHAQITEYLNLSGERRTPPPCCTPTKLIPESLIYMRDTIISLTYVQSVESCGCR